MSEVPPEDPTARAESQDPESVGAEDIGSVGDEASKLIDALSGWAKEQAKHQGGDLGQGLAGLGALAGQAAATFSEVNEHIATGSAECTYCPVCRTVHAIRQTSPEVRTHLAHAAASLLQAGAQLLATAVPEPEQGQPRSRNVEPIRLDDDE